jgi:hypothetical protein
MEGNVMGKIDNSATVERLEKFQADHLTADELYRVAGGLAPASGPSSGVSICHIDGIDFPDPPSIFC